MRISDWSSDVCSSELTDSIFVQAFGRKILLDVAGPAKFIFGGLFRGGKRFGVADNHGAVLVSHAISPARLSSEEHTSELQSLMRTSYAVFCLTKKKHI